jgi:hypothetical protein
VKWFKQLSLAAQDFVEIQEAFGKARLKLIHQSNVTRWNSIYHMLNRYVVRSQAVNAVLLKHTHAQELAIS